MSETPRLYLASRRRKGHTVVTAVGTIAQATVIQLRTLLLQTLARRERSLLLDLSGVDHIDDAGLDALRRTAARAQLVGGQLRLVAPSPRVAERLRSSCLRHHVAVEARLAEVLGTAATATPAGPEDPRADRLEQHQPADPVGPVDRRLPVPVDEEDYPTGT